MEGLKESLAYAVELSEPHYMDHGGELYSDKPLHRVSYNPLAETKTMHTLSGLVEYIKSDVDALMDFNWIVHIVDPTLVKLYSALDTDRKREYLVDVTAKLPDFSFNRFLEHESFCIAMQSKFLQNEDRDLVLKFAGTVEENSVQQYSDDGVSQQASVKKGIAGREVALVPNPVSLIPYRTFLEVDQPESNFIFRMRSDCGIECAIFEADGGAWQIEAMQNIKKYLTEALADLPQFTVIA